MSSSLTKNDYIKILNYYKIPIPESYDKLKHDAEKMLAEKLCRCIKSVGVKNEQRSIAICSRSIFNKKGLTRGRFKCKNNKSVTFKKQKKRILKQNKRSQNQTRTQKSIASKN